MSSDIGVYGLAVMGQNLALNLAEKGFIVSVGNRFDPGEEDRLRQSDMCPLKVDKTVARATEESLKVLGFRTIEEFTASLKRPRKVTL
jgi:6-phosphogluconate dehydrogenase